MMYVNTLIALKECHDEDENNGKVDLSPLLSALLLTCLTYFKLPYWIFKAVHL